MKLMLTQGLIAEIYNNKKWGPERVVFTGQNKKTNVSWASIYGDYKKQYDFSNDAPSKSTRRFRDIVENPNKSDITLSEKLAFLYMLRSQSSEFIAESVLHSTENIRFTGNVQEKLRGPIKLMDLQITDIERIAFQSFLTKPIENVALHSKTPAERAASEVIEVYTVDNGKVECKGDKTDQVLGNAENYFTEGSMQDFAKASEYLVYHAENGHVSESEVTSFKWKIIDRKTFMAWMNLYTNTRKDDYQILPFSVVLSGTYIDSEGNILSELAPRSNENRTDRNENHLYEIAYTRMKYDCPEALTYYERPLDTPDGYNKRHYRVQESYTKDQEGGDREGVRALAAAMLKQHMRLVFGSIASDYDFSKSNSPEMTFVKRSLGIRIAEKMVTVGDVKVREAPAAFDQISKLPTGFSDKIRVNMHLGAYLFGLFSKKGEDPMLLNYIPYRDSPIFVRKVRDAVKDINKPVMTLDGTKVISKDSDDLKLGGTDLKNILEDAHQRYPGVTPKLTALEPGLKKMMNGFILFGKYYDNGGEFQNNASSEKSNKLYMDMLLREYTTDLSVLLGYPNIKDRYSKPLESIPFRKDIWEGFIGTLLTLYVGNQKGFINTLWAPVIKYGHSVLENTASDVYQAKDPKKESYLELLTKVAKEINDNSGLKMYLEVINDLPLDLFKNLIKESGTDNSLLIAGVFRLLKARFEQPNFKVKVDSTKGNGRREVVMSGLDYWGTVNNSDFPDVGVLEGTLAVLKNSGIRFNLEPIIGEGGRVRKLRLAIQPLYEQDMKSADGINYTSDESLDEIRRRISTVSDSMGTNVAVDISQAMKLVHLLFTTDLNIGQSQDILKGQWTNFIMGGEIAGKPYSPTFDFSSVNYMNASKNTDAFLQHKKMSFADRFRFLTTNQKEISERWEIFCTTTSMQLGTLPYVETQNSFFTIDGIFPSVASTQMSVFPIDILSVALSNPDYFMSKVTDITGSPQVRFDTIPDYILSTIVKDKGGSSFEFNGDRYNFKAGEVQAEFTRLWESIWKVANLNTQLGPNGVKFSGMDKLLSEFPSLFYKIQRYEASINTENVNTPGKRNEILGVKVPSVMMNPFVQVFELQKGGNASLGSAFIEEPGNTFAQMFSMGAEGTIYRQIKKQSREDYSAKHVSQLRLISSIIMELDKVAGIQAAMAGSTGTAEAFNEFLQFRFGFGDIWDFTRAIILESGFKINDALEYIRVMKSFYYKNEEGIAKTYEGAIGRGVTSAINQPIVEKVYNAILKKPVAFLSTALVPFLGSEIQRPFKNIPLIGGAVSIVAVTALQGGAYVLAPGLSFAAPSVATALIPAVIVGYVVSGVIGHVNRDICMEYMIEGEHLKLFKWAWMKAVKLVAPAFVQKLDKNREDKEMMEALQLTKKEKYINLNLLFHPTFIKEVWGRLGVSEADLEFMKEIRENPGVLPAAYEYRENEGPQEPKEH